MSDRLKRFVERVESRAARVGVVGLGYVGLPLALRCVEMGFHVTGIETDATRVQAVGEGRSYLVDVTDESLAQANLTGRFQVTDSYASVDELDVILITVPTPLRGESPDLTYVLSAADAITDHLRPGSLVSLESTTYPGTTEDVLRPRLSAGGLAAGEDFFLAFSPERVDPGNPSYSVAEIPKVVGGVTRRCSVAASAFYGVIANKVVTVRGPKEAEMAKLLENTYRQVNIALANEFAMVAHELDIDIWEVIDAAATKPFGFQPFYPGVGVGGHCIAVDPVYLTWRIRELGRAPFRIVELAREVDISMPTYVARRIAQTLRDRDIPLRGAKVFALGVTYKPDVNDVRESRALNVLAELRDEGADVMFHDPMRATITLDGSTLERTELDEGLAAADLVAILTHHSTYDWADIVRRSRYVFDARGVTRGIESENLQRL